MKTRNLTFVIYQDVAGEWRWTLNAGNGRIIADSAEGYDRRRGVERAVRAINRRMFPPADVVDGELVDA